MEIRDQEAGSPSPFSVEDGIVLKGYPSSMKPSETGFSSA